MTAPNRIVAQRGKVNEQHQNVAKLVVQKNLAIFLATHQETPRTTTQPRVVIIVYHDDNHEPIQPFDEVVSIQQPWSFVTPSYNLRITGASTPITFVVFQNQPPYINIHLIPTNSDMEQLHLLNRLEQLRHIDQKSSYQSISIPPIKPIEPKAIPKVV